MHVFQYNLSNQAIMSYSVFLELYYYIIKNQAFRKLYDSKIVVFP